MTRFAIYLVPKPDSALWQFGCGALGYDSSSGNDMPFHDHAFYSANRADDVTAWTEDPRRYGFHATLKPPFALKDGTTADKLEAAAASFVAARKRFVVERLTVNAIGDFLALVPAEMSPQLQQLAGDCVRHFEPFRAPLSSEDRARRLMRPLSDSQMNNLDQWGYPYVFDEFRFHMTLSGRLAPEVKSEAAAALSQLYARNVAPLDVDAICICEQPNRTSRFRVRRRFAFAV